MTCARIQRGCARLAADGYLPIRGLHDRDQVLATEPVDERWIGERPKRRYAWDNPQKNVSLDTAPAGKCNRPVLGVP